MPKLNAMSIITAEYSPAGALSVGQGAYDPRLMVAFSVCIPSFNAAGTLAETIVGVLSSEASAVEIWVSDNASTDGTADVAMAVDDPRVHVQVNRTNVGPASNLDRAVRPSSGSWVLLLARGQMEPGALAAYDAIAGAVGERAVITGRARQVDDSDRDLGLVGPDLFVWRGAPVNRDLSELIGRRVLELDAATLLERSVSTMRDPFHPATTAYPRTLFDLVGGYLGARTVSTEKWFHWRLLTVADRAIFIDEPLFCVPPHHDGPPTGGPLPLAELVDDYVSSFEQSPGLLDRSGLDRREVERAFLEHDIARRGLASLARGERATARRLSSFGLAAYPSHARKNLRWWLLRVLVALGPVGETAARTAHRSFVPAGLTPDHDP